MEQVREMLAAADLLAAVFGLVDIGGGARMPLHPELLGKITPEGQPGAYAALSALAQELAQVNAASPSPELTRSDHLLALLRTQAFSASWEKLIASARGRAGTKEGAERQQLPLVGERADAPSPPRRVQGAGVPLRSAPGGARDGRSGVTGPAREGAALATVGGGGEPVLSAPRPKAAPWEKPARVQRGAAPPAMRAAAEEAAAAEKAAAAAERAKAERVAAALARESAARRAAGEAAVEERRAQQKKLSEQAPKSACLYPPSSPGTPLPQQPARRRRAAARPAAPRVQSQAAVPPHAPAPQPAAQPPLPGIAAELDAVEAGYVRGEREAVAKAAGERAARLKPPPPLADLTESDDEAESEELETAAAVAASEGSPAAVAPEAQAVPVASLFSPLTPAALADAAPALPLCHQAGAGELAARLGEVARECPGGVGGLPGMIPPPLATSSDAGGRAAAEAAEAERGEYLRLLRKAMGVELLASSPPSPFQSFQVQVKPWDGGLVTLNGLQGGDTVAILSFLLAEKLRRLPTPFTYNGRLLPDDSITLEAAGIGRGAPSTLCIADRLTPRLQTPRCVKPRMG